MRQLVVQLLKERTSDKFGDGFFGTFLAQLLGRVHLRTFRRVIDQHGTHFVKIVVFQGADRYDIGEVGEFIDFDELGDELFAREFVDFGDNGD